MKGVRILEPGFLTTVQDLGRIGHQQTGMVVAGAMDPWSLQLANILVGNPRNTGGLEITMLGPKLEFEIDTVIALTGADLQPKINGKPVESWLSIVVKRGSILEFGGLKGGCRGYLAVSGGFDLPLMLGSQSTYLRASLGGYQGRSLQAGDHIPLKEPLLNPATFRVKWHLTQPDYPQEKEIRVIRGPECDQFTADGLQTFYQQSYEVTNLSDRMGYRLKGPKIESKGSHDIISDGIPFGGIQVPADGMPIILMADRQTTGGYTRIGTVITADLPLVGQSKPGDSFSFREVTVDKAQEEYLQLEGLLESLEKYV